eukprot:15481315-Alexandrium_andersonii.AAC.2
MTDNKATHMQESAMHSEEHIHTRDNTACRVCGLVGGGCNAARALHACDALKRTEQRMNMHTGE